MAALFHNLAQAKRLFLLAVLSLFCLGLVLPARAISRDATGFARAWETQLKEEQPASGQEACTGDFALEDEGRTGLFAGNNSVCYINPFGFAWYDDTAAYWRGRAAAAQNIMNNSGSVFFATVVNSVIDVGVSVVSAPAVIGNIGTATGRTGHYIDEPVLQPLVNLGTGSGNYSANPSLANLAGVAQDLSTAAGTAAMGFSGLPGAKTPLGNLEKMGLGKPRTPPVKCPTTGSPKWPGTDPTKAPPGTQWRGQPGSTPGSGQGNYYNPNTGETFRPDLNHPAPIPPHWDYRAPDGTWYRIMPDGSVVPK